LLDIYISIFYTLELLKISIKDFWGTFPGNIPRKHSQETFPGNIPRDHGQGTGYTVANTNLSCG
jgi:hypothetical protein